MRRADWAGDEEALGAFGAAIGLAFQLLDDVLDVSGPPERTGKARGTDLLDGTVTLPLILAAERTRGSARPTCARSTRPAPRRSATGSPRPARSTRSGRGRWRWSPRRKRGLGRRRPRRRAAASCSSLVADGVVAALQLSRVPAEVVGGEQVGLERGGEGVGDVLHVLPLELA